MTLPLKFTLGLKNLEKFKRKEDNIYRVSTMHRAKHFMAYIINLIIILVVWGRVLNPFCQ